MKEHLINEVVITLMMDRFVTREELCDMLHCSDRMARKEIQWLKMHYPIIHTSNHKGYKIACRESEIKMVEDSIKNNRNKALSIFKGSKQLKAFMQSISPEKADQLQFNFEL